MRSLGPVLALAVVLAPAALAGARAPGVLYVAAGGRDANPCSEAAPCATFQRAYSRAPAGGTVLVEPGSYPRQRLASDNPRLRPTARVTFRPASGRVVVAELDLEGADDLVFRGIQFGRGTVADRAWYQIYSSHTLCDRCTIRGQLAIDGGDADGARGTRDASFTNGTVGGYVANDSDPQIGGMRGPTYPHQFQPTNVSFVNETFHDVDASSQDPHTECLQVLAVHGLTIRHSRFVNCNEHGNGSKNSIMFSGYDAHGTNDDYWNVTLDDDMFTGGPAGSNRIAFSWDDQFGFERDCRHIVVRNSTIQGTVLWGCPQKRATTVEHTILTFQWTGSWAARQCNAVFRDDLWESSGHCPGTNVRSGHPLSFVNPVDDLGLDLHLRPGSYGAALGVGVR